MMHHYNTCRFTTTFGGTLNIYYSFNNTGTFSLHSRQINSYSHELGLTGKPTGKFRKTYCLQPKQFAMWQMLIAMQAQISARACFSATKVGRHAAVPPFHILLVFRQLHFFFLGWRCRYTIQISPHVVFTISCQATFSRLNAAVHQRNNSG